MKLDSADVVLCLSTKTADISYYPQSKLLYTIVKAEEPFGIDTVKEWLANEQKLVKGERHAQVITFATGFISPSKEAREYAAHMLSTLNKVSIAFVVEHLPVRLILNSFITYNKPGITIKMFASVKEAEKWSEQQLMLQP